MKLSRLKVRDFQSIGLVEFDFPNGLVLIDGWNEELGSANGAGKSALLNAVTYAIYGDTPKSINLAGLIRLGADKMTTDIHLESNGKKIHIKRSRFTNGGGVGLTVDGTQVEGTSKILEEKIVELLGMTFAQFTQVVYIFQGAANRFVTLNDTEKKKFLSSLLDLELYDKAYKATHEKLGVVELDLSRSTGSMTTLVSERETMLSMVTSLNDKSKSFSIKMNNEVISISAEVDLVKAQLVDLENQKAQQKNSTKIAELESQLGLLRNQLSLANKDNIKMVQLKSQIDNEDKLLQASTRRLANQETKCSMCQQDLPHDSVHKYRNNIEGTINEAKEKMKSLGAEWIQLRSTMPNTTEIQSKIDSIIGEIGQEKQNGPEKFDPQIKLKKQELVILSNRFQTLETEKQSIKSELDRLNGMLGTIDQKITNAQLASIKLEERKRILADVKKVFSPVGIKAFVFDGVINQLNDTISKYLDRLTSGMIKFAFITDNEKGKFSEQCEYGGRLRDVNSLSGGEFKRLSLAVDLALSDVVCSRTAVYPSVLFLDEAFEGLDIVGRESVMNLLQDVSQTKDGIYVIDHASEFKTSFAQVVRLVKRNGETVRE